MAKPTTEQQKDYASLSVKSCSRCKVEKPLSDFHKDKTTVWGVKQYCKLCVRPIHRGWADSLEGQAWLAEKRIQDKGRKRGSTREHRLLTLYGLTLERYQEILDRQGGRCAICKADNPGKIRDWQVDHDHACCPGKSRSCGACVRGLLCARCNPMLGFARDNPAVLEAAISYLRSSGGV